MSRKRRALELESRLTALNMNWVGKLRGSRWMTSPQSSGATPVLGLMPRQGVSSRVPAGRVGVTRAQETGADKEEGLEHDHSYFLMSDSQ